jgi:hypothetical protein
MSRVHGAPAGMQSLPAGTQVRPHGVISEGTTGNDRLCEHCRPMGPAGRLEGMWVNPACSASVNDSRIIGHVVSEETE